jgi:hypothetical protein
LDFFGHPLRRRTFQGSVLWAAMLNVKIAAIYSIVQVCDATEVDFCSSAHSIKIFIAINLQISNQTSLTALVNHPCILTATTL